MLVDTAFEGWPFTIWSVSGFYDLIQEKKEKFYSLIWGILRIPSPSRNPGKPIEFVTDWSEGSVCGMAGLRDHPKGYN